MNPQWKQGRIPTNNSYIHYYRTGQGDKEPIVLVHGFSDNGLCWTPVARALEEKYDVIMPDMKSHGLSARVSQEEPLDMASDVVELMQSLGLSRPIIVGHSMGAMIAFQVGVRHPDLAKAMVLEDPPWFIIPEGEENKFPPPTMDWARQLPYQTLEELEAGNRRDHPTWPEEMIRIMSESKKQFDPTFMDVIFSSQRGGPLLLISGNPELGGIVTGEVTAQIQKSNPQVQIKNLPDVGHLIRFDKFDEFMTILVAFLEDL
jgi:pimeloyl-ACP methyl ester carboxylesterase